MLRMSFSSTGDTGIQRLEDRAPAAIARALNRSITSASVVMSRSIRADLGVSKAAVERDFVVLPARPDKLKTSLEARGKRIPLINFRASGPEPSRGRGVGVRARVQGGVKVYPGTFIATMRSGHRGVYRRKGSKRLPILELFGPSIAKVFMKFLPEGLARAQEQLAKNLEHELSFAMRGSPAN